MFKKTVRIEKDPSNANCEGEFTLLREPHYLRRTVTKSMNKENSYIERRF